MRQEQRYLERPAPSGIADVVDTILAKGVVLDAYARVSALGIEVLTVDARIVISSMDTYLRFAEATHRLDLFEHTGRGLPEVLAHEGGEVVERVASKVVERKVDDAMDRLGDTLGGPTEKAARVVGEKVVETAEDVAARAAQLIEHTEPHGVARRLPSLLWPDH